MAIEYWTALCYNESSKQGTKYLILNPSGEFVSSLEPEYYVYQVADNAAYTYKVIDILTNKVYTKSIEVNNIDTSLPPLMISTDSLTARTNDTQITLQNVKENKNETFEKAYIVYNNEKIDITSLITQKTGDDSQEYSSISTSDIGIYLERELKVIPYFTYISNTNQTIILEKDGREYKNVVNMGDIEYV